MNTKITDASSHCLLFFCFFFPQGESVKYFLDNLEKLGQSVSLSLSPQLLLDSRCALKFYQLHSYIKREVKLPSSCPKAGLLTCNKKKKRTARISLLTLWLTAQGPTASSRCCWRDKGAQDKTRVCAGQKPCLYQDKLCS